jgi:hypothetical protein
MLDIEQWRIVAEADLIGSAIALVTASAIMIRGNRKRGKAHEDQQRLSGQIAHLVPATNNEFQFRSRDEAMGTIDGMLDFMGANRRTRPRR